MQWDSVMRAAAEGRAASDLKLLAVTVLTSFGRADLDELGYNCEVSDLVERRARQAIAAGMDGIVASPLEAAALRRIVGASAILVTPGVRSAGAARAIRSAWPPPPKPSATAPIIW
jgi:orotidine-5'-phosphate decarboxylase